MVFTLLYIHISLFVLFIFFSFFRTIKYLNSFLNRSYTLHKYLKRDSITDIYVFATNYPSLDCGTSKCTLICNILLITPILPVCKTSKCNLIRITLFIAPTLPKYRIFKYTLIFMTLIIASILPNRRTP